MKKTISLLLILAMTEFSCAIAETNINYTQYNPLPSNNYNYNQNYGYNNANYGNYNNTYNNNYNNGNGYTNYQNSYQQYMPPLQGRVVVIPAGTEINAITTFPIDTETLVQGQSVSLTLPQDFYYNGTLVANAGSTINGVVSECSNARRTGRNARLKILFNSIITPYGQAIPISGIIKTDDGTGLLVGGTAMDTTKEYAKDIAIGSGTGAVLGVIGAAVSGGRIGKGAALMTAVGAGGGLAKALWDKGGDISIPTNSQVSIQITQAATITMPSNYNY